MPSVVEEAFEKRHQPIHFDSVVAGAFAVADVGHHAIDHLAAEEARLAIAVRPTEEQLHSIQLQEHRRIVEVASVHLLYPSQRVSHRVLVGAEPFRQPQEVVVDEVDEVDEDRDNRSSFQVVQES